MSLWTKSIINPVLRRPGKKAQRSLSSDAMCLRTFLVPGHAQPRRIPVIVNWKTEAMISWRLHHLCPFRAASMFTRLKASSTKEWHHRNFLSEASVDKKEAWLDTLLTRSPEHADTEEFLVVLRALAVSKLPDAALRAERWLRRLEQQQASSACLPNAECYQRVIEAWAAVEKQDPAIAVTRAERWLWKHVNNESSSDERLQPNTACFNAFLDGCSKGRALKGSHSKKLVRRHAEKAEETLQYMIDQRKECGATTRAAPDTDSFNYVIRAWTRCRRSTDLVDKAMHVLGMLENYQATVDERVKPDTKSYAMVMDAIGVRARLKATRCRLRNIEDPSENGLNEIELLNNILDYMRKKTDAGDYSMAPNTQTYNMLIAAWANLSRLHRNAPLEAEKVLQHMTSLKDDGDDIAAPDAVSYTLVMRAWGNCDEPNRGHRVTWLLSKQWKDSDFEGSASLRPTTATYNTAIRVWMDLGEPLKAEKIFFELVQFSEQDESGKLSPNSESYAYVIRAWLAVANNGSKEALATAAQWLDVLVEREKQDTGLVSSVELYSSILRAARKCASLSPDVLDLAVETFEKLRASHHTVDCLDYSRLLQIGLLAMSRRENNATRTEFIKEVVHCCCEDGLISGEFLGALADGPIFYDGWTIEESSRVVEDLFPDWPLPASWTRNIRQVRFLPEHADLSRTKFKISRHGVDPYKG